MLLKGLLSYRETAERYGFTEQYLRELAMTHDWPPAERVIGNTKFFARDSIALFFEEHKGRPARKKSEQSKKRKRRRH